MHMYSNCKPSTPLVAAHTALMNGLDIDVVSLVEYAGYFGCSVFGAGATAAAAEYGLLSVGAIGII